MKPLFRTKAGLRKITNSGNIFNAFGISIILIFSPSCVAQQSDMEALGLHVQASATQVQELSQSVAKLREAQDVMGSLLAKRGDGIIQQAGRLSERMNAIETYQATLTQQIQSNTKKTSTFMDQLRQSVEQIATRLQDLEIHQSGLVGKLDADAQTTTTYLQEVNEGIKSVAQALENVSAKLNARIVRQEQELSRAVTSFQSVQNSIDTTQVNVPHIVEVAEAMSQLQGLINTIGTKLGERVDEHEHRLGEIAARVNRLQSSKQQLQPNTSIPFAPERTPSQSAGNSGGQGCYEAAISKPQPFLGNGGEIIILDDGTTWKELSHQYLYLYEYYPSVIVCPSTGKMFLDEHEFEIVPAN